MEQSPSVAALREHDSVVITNPTSEDFTWQYNGEPYTVSAGTAKGFSKYVAFHLAKHLSTKIMEDDFKKLHKKTFEKDRQLQGKLAQMTVFDGPERRKALYRIMRDAPLVEEVIRAYPFRGWIGEMSEYQDYVAKEEAAALSEVKS